MSHVLWFSGFRFCGYAEIGLLGLLGVLGDSPPLKAQRLVGVLCIIKSKSTAESSSDSAKVGTIPVSALDSAFLASGFL